MRAIPFNTGWTFLPLDEDGPALPVTFPHDAMLAEPRSETSAGGINTGWYRGRDYRYTKVFTPDPQWEGQVLTLEFEGVYHNAEVWLNGRQLAFRPYGYTNFYVELTEKLVFGAENTLEVIARNADQPNSRWYSGAGIYRPVTLWVAPKEHILLNSLRLRTLSLSPAVVEVSLRTAGAGTVEVEILDGGRVVASAQGASDGSFVREITIPEGQPWRVDAPHLYTCHVRFGRDTDQTAFGLRTLEWGEKGLLLNGERVILKGACIHHDHAMLGACCYPDAEERRVRLLKETGYNALRSAHNPCSKALLEACDKLGMLMMDEYIDHWYIHKTEHDYVDYFMDWWKQDLRDMVEKDYNHPSVILYSTGNEVSETAQPKGIALTKEMTGYLHSLDDSRPVTCGVNIFFNFLYSLGMGQYSDKKAEKNAKRQAEDAKKKKKKKAVGSEFFNNLAGLLGAKFMKFGATLRGSDRKTRDAFAKMDIAGYNYGINRYKKDVKKYPDRIILGSETFCSDAYKFWEFAKDHPSVIGDFVWAGMDYMGEVGVGSWVYEDHTSDFSFGIGWLTAGSGRVDINGGFLGEADYTRVAFELDKMHLAVIPAHHAGKKHSPSAWKHTNAMANWSYDGCDGVKTKAEVYVRAYRVELLLNGRKAGAKKLKKDCRAVIPVRYAPGTLTAVAYDKAGNEIARTSLVTAGKETVLAASPEDNVISPDGLAYIHLRYTDEAGTLKPLTRSRIKVTGTEGGELIAFGHACPYNPDGFGGKDTDTYLGEALAVVRPTGAGTIKLTAESEFGSAEAAIEVKKKETDKTVTDAV